jgi:cytochrome c nitrite reductase small subunit
MPGPATTTPTPSPRPSGRGVMALAVGVAIAGGVLAGVGAFTFGYAEGLSYLSSDPNACTNCHVMRGHFDSWVKSSHHHVAACNDCHLPHHPIGKWVTKADNGLFHSAAFTLGNFHEPIQIKPRNRRVTQSACTHCHADLTDQIHPGPGAGFPGEPVLCVHCHADVGHAGR